MKKSVYFSISALLITLAISTSSIAQMNVWIADTLSKVMSQYKSKLAMNGVACAVHLPDGTVWSEAQGNYGNNSLTTNMLFDIGSNTKTMVASIILMLEEENKLSIDDPLSDYVTTNTDVTPGITLKQLLSHKSGVYSYTNHPDFIDEILNNPNKFWTPDELLNQFMNSAIFPPGISFDYSNTNYLLLGKVIENIESKPLNQVFRDRIFTPNNLNNIYLDAYDSYSLPKPGTWWSSTNHDNTNYTSFMSSAWAAGGVIATPEEFATWGYHMYRGDMLSSTSMQKMMAGETTLFDGSEYGLGAMKQTIDGFDYYLHGGTTLQNSEVHYSLMSDFCLATFNIDVQYTDETNELQVAMLKVIEHEVARFINSVEEEITTSKINIYPNPSVDRITIEIPEQNFEQENRIEVYAVNGQLLFNQKFNSTSISINKYELSKGLFIVHVYQGEELISREKVIFE